MAGTQTIDLCITNRTRYSTCVKDRQGSIVLEISDTGIGISQDDIEKYSSFIFILLLTGPMGRYSLSLLHL